jgi:hypothetical protein
MYPAEAPQASSFVGDLELVSIEDYSVFGTKDKDETSFDTGCIESVIYGS